MQPRLFTFGTAARLVTRSVSFPGITATPKRIQRNTEKNTFTASCAVWLGTFSPTEGRGGGIRNGTSGTGSFNAIRCCCLSVGLLAGAVSVEGDFIGDTLLSPTTGTQQVLSGFVRKRTHSTQIATVHCKNLSNPKLTRPPRVPVPGLSLNLL